jgi:hypothetical protein
MASITTTPTDPTQNLYSRRTPLHPAYPYTPTSKPDLKTRHVPDLTYNTPGFKRLWANMTTTPTDQTLNRYSSRTLLCLCGGHVVRLSGEIKMRCSCCFGSEHMNLQCIECILASRPLCKSIMLIIIYRLPHTAGQSAIMLRDVEMAAVSRRISLFVYRPSPTN